MDNVRFVRFSSSGLFRPRAPPEQKSFDVSISRRPMMMIRTQRKPSLSLSRSDEYRRRLKTRDRDKKRTPPEIGFASRENLFS